MTKKEIKAFIRRKDVKLSIAISIMSIAFFFYLERNWTLLYILEVVLIVSFLVYVEVKDFYKKK